MWALLIRWGPGQSGCRKSIPGTLQIAQGLPTSSRFQNHPVSQSVGLGGAGGAGHRLCLSYTLSDMTLGPQADGVTRKPVPPLLPHSGCRAGGLASKESTTVPAGFMQGCDEAHHWFLHVLPLWMLSLPTKPTADYH